MHGLVTFHKPEGELHNLNAKLAHTEMTGYVLPWQTPNMNTHFHGNTVQPQDKTHTHTPHFITRKPGIQK